MQKTKQCNMKCPGIVLCFHPSLLQVFEKQILVNSCVSCFSLSFTSSVSVTSQCVSPGQQAGAVGIDEGVAIGTEGWDVRGGGRAGAEAGHETEEAEERRAFSFLERWEVSSREVA